MRYKPHFKVFLSVQNHVKAPFWEDPMLRGIWIGLCVLAIERWADRTGDSFLCTSTDLMGVTGTERPVDAIKRIRWLESRSTITVVREEYRSPMGAVSEGHRWRVTIPNLQRKQFTNRFLGTVCADQTRTSLPLTLPLARVRRGDGGLGGVERGQEGQERSERDPSYAWPKEIPPLHRAEFLKVVAFAKTRGFRGDIRPPLEQAIRQVGSNSHSQSWRELMDGMTFEQLQAELQKAADGELEKIVQDAPPATPPPTELTREDRQRLSGWVKEAHPALAHLPHLLKSLVVDSLRRHANDRYCDWVTPVQQDIADWSREQVFVDVYLH